MGFTISKNQGSGRTVITVTPEEKNATDKDIEIKYTGLRPGEKLYEELLNNKENTKETPHEKIRVAAVREYDYKDVITHIHVLIELSLRVQILPMVREMKAFVPEFKSQNSRFEELD